MELMNQQTTEQEQHEVKMALLRELADVELALVGGGMGSVIFDD